MAKKRIALVVESGRYDEETLNRASLNLISALSKREIRVTCLHKKTVSTENVIVRYVKTVPDVNKYTSVIYTLNPKQLTNEVIKLHLED